MFDKIDLSIWNKICLSCYFFIEFFFEIYKLVVKLFVFGY